MTTEINAEINCNFEAVLAATKSAIMGAEEENLENGKLLESAGIPTPNLTPPPKSKALNSSFETQLSSATKLKLEIKQPCNGDSIRDVTPSSVNTLTTVNTLQSTVGNSDFDGNSTLASGTLPEKLSYQEKDGLIAGNSAFSMKSTTSSGYNSNPLEQSAQNSPLLKRKTGLSENFATPVDTGSNCEVIANVHINISDGKESRSASQSRATTPGQSPALVRKSKGKKENKHSEKNHKSKLDEADKKHVRINQIINEHASLEGSPSPKHYKVKILRAKAPCAENDEINEYVLANGGFENGDIPGLDVAFSPFKRKLAFRKRYVSKKCSKIMKTVIKFMFSHIGLVFLVICYTFAGALMFPLMEKNRESEIREIQHKKTENLAHKLMDFVWNISFAVLEDDSYITDTQIRYLCGNLGSTSIQELKE